MDADSSPHLNPNRLRNKAEAADLVEEERGNRVLWRKNNNHGFTGVVAYEVE